jgi:rhodanese-related sulfurtransferase
MSEGRPCPSIVSILFQERTMPFPNSISTDKLCRMIGTPRAPALIDVRSDEEFAADARLVPGSIRRDSDEISEWGKALAGHSVIVICQLGKQVAHGTAAWLRHLHVKADVLEGGFEAWKAAKLPLVPTSRIPARDAQGRTVWVTRARPKVDRIACPWLIRRFVDPAAVFLHVARSEAAAVSGALMLRLSIPITPSLVTVANYALSM